MIFDPTQCNLFSIGKANSIYRDVEFPGSSHAPLGFRIRDGSPRNRGFRNHNLVSNLDFLKNLKVDRFVCGGIGGRKVP